MDSEHLEDGLTDEDQQFLCVMLTLEDVREAVFSIDPDRVAGPDGFGAVFFHTCWEIIFEDVFGAVIEFFHGVEMPKGFTTTTISHSEDSQPNLLDGFVPGRFLSDNVLLAQELIQSLESRRPEANVVFKLDMAKAYDWVSWEFLYQVSSLQTQAVQYVLGYQLKHLPVTYLGVPLYQGNKKAYLFNSTFSWLQYMLQDWAMTNLSHGGRLALIRSSISFWHDNWLGEKPLAHLLHRDTYTMEPVSYYWHEGDWNVPRILRTVPIHFAQTICQIPIAASQGDKIVWTGSSAGDFSTKLAWEAIRQTSPRRQLLADIWHRSLRPTILDFLWQLFQDRIPVDARMQQKGFSFPSKCCIGHRDQCASRAHYRLARFGACPTHSLAPLVVEVDATMVITLLQSRVSGKWEVQHLIMRIVRLQQLLVADVQHVFREANGAADDLAKEATSLQLTWVLHHNDITGVLRDIFCLDRRGVPHLRRG
ncbi:UNVERIFIED_CONTAM: hypothetical protein Scaly_2517200 [Sesamum calycinum]|uniref:RNase H type-1 domain-containing protein n=1 Tax=Sesamum calycinum TaxID=2727403 RepID=A0AAW2LVB8_9LAMI